MYRKTIGKRMAAKLKEIRQELERRRHASNAETQEWLKTVVRGYFQYHALPDNQRRMRQFRGDVLRDIPGLVSGLRPDIRGRNRVC